MLYLKDILTNSLSITKEKRGGGCISVGVEVFVWVVEVKWLFIEQLQVD
jgi:hypothetical protein